MVTEFPRLKLRSYWAPTQASAERMSRMNMEFSLNQRSEKMPHSIAEVACSSGSIDQALSILPPVVPPPIRSQLRDLLQPWPDGRYIESYRRSGGILNLFTPPWGEEQDKGWKDMLARWETSEFAGDDARREALQALEQEWNTTPHPFFAGLTPAQVMVGGGPREAELAEEFLSQLTQMYDGHPFESEGEALIQTLTVLRGWQCQPRQEGQTPFDIIASERTELLARRAQALA